MTVPKVITAIDPGYEQSAVLTLDAGTLTDHRIAPNAQVLDWLRESTLGGVLVLEQVESFGMAVGREVFETVYVTGRFAEAWFPRWVERMPRRMVKSHLCHSGRATDANIRQALIDRFGPTTEKAIGTKKQPGPLYGIKSHEWAALALAVTFDDQHGREDVVRPGVAAEF